MSLSHCPPDPDDIKKNVSVEPIGEKIRAELIDFLERNRISSLFIETPEHRVDIQIAKLPPRVKNVLSVWGSVYVKNDAPYQSTFKLGG